MTNAIFQHFRKEEQTFIRQVEEWVNECQTQYVPVLTEFLDPRQQFIVESVAGQYEDVSFSFDGGYLSSERKRCMIYPVYFEPASDDFELGLFSINYPKKFATLSHGKILGSLMGIGIDREVIGDIITDGEQWQFFCSKQMSSYIQQQLTKIGKVSIRLDSIDYTHLLIPEDHWENTLIIVSSLRVDVIISNVFNISRQKAKELVESGNVKINWSEENRPDFAVEILDILSVRRYGRVRVQNIEGRTKKDKIKLEIGLLEKNK